MPKATVSAAVEHYELKSLEGAWVELKRLSYGQKQTRQDMVTKLAVEATPSKRGSRQQEMKGIMEMSAAAVTEFDFKHCLVDHNLFSDDEETVKMVFPRDMELLDPRVGEEISSLMDSLNNFEVEDQQGN